MGEGLDDSVERFVRLATPAMALVDLHGHIVEVSGSFADAVGAVGEVVGLPLTQCGPAAWADGCARAAEGELVRGEATEHLAAAGRRWLSWTLQRWNPQRLVLVVEDVTAARRALAESERRETRLYAQVRGLSALARSSGAATADLSALSADACELVATTLGVTRVDVWMLDARGRTLSCLDRYDDALQSHTTRAALSIDDVPVLHLIAQQGHLARAEILGDPIMETSLAFFDEGAGAALLAGVTVGATLLGVIVCQSGAGRDWSLEDRAFATSAASTLALAVETTRRRAAEDQAHEAQARAEAADRAKGDFLATMSHEIRTPMNGVIGFTNLLLDSALDDEQRAYMSTIKASADSLLTLINDILDFSKIEAGKFELESAPFDLEGLLGDALELCAARAEEKGVALALDYAPGVPRLFQGDGGRVRQVALNLVGNALKFTADGVVCVRVCAHGSGVKVDVVDSGIGISADALPRLFARFAQADSTTKRKYGGTGLGLAISRKLIELMGGDIGVDSVLGTGSTFWFTLTGALAVSAEAPRASSSSLRVLLIERHEAVQRMWVNALAALDAQVSCVATPAEVPADADFGLIITDDATVAATARGRVLLRVKQPGQDRPASGATVARSAVRAEVLAKAARRALQLDAGLTLVSSQPSPTPQRLLEGQRVLLVEDNRVNQRLAERLLARRGCVVTLAENGLEGVDRWAKGAFDVVLMDCNMPELDGFEATARIRQLERERAQPRTPIIALTADAMEGDRQRCLAAGMDDYLSKPLLDDKLVAVLNGYWTQRQRAMESVG